jgi:hypothetical protein
MTDRNLLADQLAALVVMGSASGRVVVCNAGVRDLVVAALRQSPADDSPGAATSAFAYRFERADGSDVKIPLPTPIMAKE